MSLKVRLLLAVGAVALVALIGTDVATYSALKSYLYTRIDQQLESAHPPIEAALDRRESPTFANLGRLASGLYIEVRKPDGSVVATLPGFAPGEDLGTPAIPAHIHVPSASGGSKTATTVTPTTAAGGPTPPGPAGPGVSGGGSGATSRAPQLIGEPATYLTVGSKPPGGPQYRVRVSVLDNGNQLIIAIPLGTTASTLRQLGFIELAGTAEALFVAILLGWWLVRLGMRPLVEVGRTADAIADGDLDQRVPERRPNTEVGHLAHSFNAMVSRIQEAFAERDETEHQLRESEERLRRFVSDASHELRTPLAAVAGYAELFQRGAADRPEDLPRVARGIRTETARMELLVNDLLLLARLDEGRPLERRPLELVGLAAQSVQAATAASADWPVRLEADHPLETLGDEHRLRQVLDNLLSNVRSHTPPGTSAVVRVRESGEWAIIEVEDNGPGMTAEEPARVFERFFRSDSSRTRQGGGSGLGLAIVAAIVVAHGGHVEALSAPGGGALFRVSLPLAADPDPGLAGPQPAPSGGTGSDADPLDSHEALDSSS